MDEHMETARRLLGATGEAQPSKVDAVASALRAATTTERERCVNECKAYAAEQSDAADRLANAEGWSEHDATRRAVAVHNRCADAAAVLAARLAAAEEG